MGDVFSGRESLIEFGIGLVGLLFIVALGALLGGRIAGGASRRRRHAEGPPAAGSVPSSRHKATSAVAAR